MITKILAILALMGSTLIGENVQAACSCPSAPLGYPHLRAIACMSGCTGASAMASCRKNGTTIFAIVSAPCSGNCPTNCTHVPIPPGPNWTCNVLPGTPACTFNCGGDCYYSAEPDDPEDEWISAPCI